MVTLMNGQQVYIGDVVEISSLCNGIVTKFIEVRPLYYFRGRNWSNCSIRYINDPLMHTHIHNDLTYVAKYI